MHPRIPGNQADLDPHINSATGALAPDRNERTGNLRTTFTEHFFTLAEPHIELNPRAFETCPALWMFSVDTWILSPRGDCFPRERCFDGHTAVLVRDLDVSKAAVVGLTREGVLPVRLMVGSDVIGGLDCLVNGACQVPDGELALTGSGEAWKLTALYAAAQGPDGHPPLVLVTAQDETTAAVPDATWLLNPLPGESTIAPYVVAAASHAPNGTAQADVLLASDDGRWVIAFREPAPSAPGWLRVLDVAAMSWSEVALDPALQPRSGAGYVLNDVTLYRAGGSDGTRLRGDVTAIDWRSGRIAPTQIVGEPFPFRYQPLVTWDNQGRGMIYAGGTDATGTAHNDVWSLRVGLESPTRVAQDNSALPSIAAGSLLFASGYSGRAFWWRGPELRSDETIHQDVRVVQNGGWTTANRQTLEPAPQTCPNGSNAALCGTGADWWRAPGSVCGAASCVPQSAEPSAVTMALPGVGANDFALDGSSLWVTRGTKLERWSLTASGAPVLTDTVNLGVNVRGVAVDSGTIGLATDAGFRRVSSVQGVYAPVGQAIRVCGQAVDVVPVGQGRWLVLTHLGIALIQPAAGGSVALASDVVLEKTLSGWQLKPASAAQFSVQSASALRGARLRARVAGQSHLRWGPRRSRQGFRLVAARLELPGAALAGRFRREPRRHPRDSSDHRSHLSRHRRSTGPRSDPSCARKPDAPRGLSRRRQLGYERTERSLSGPAATLGSRRGGMGQLARVGAAALFVVGTFGFVRGFGACGGGHPAASGTGASEDARPEGAAGKGAAAQDSPVDHELPPWDPTWRKTTPAEFEVVPPGPALGVDCGERCRVIASTSPDARGTRRPRANDDWVVFQADFSRILAVERSSGREVFVGEGGGGPSLSGSKVFYAAKGEARTLMVVVDLKTGERKEVWTTPKLDPGDGTSTSAFSEPFVYWKHGPPLRIYRFDLRSGELKWMSGGECLVLEGSSRGVASCAGEGFVDLVDFDAQTFVELGTKGFEESIGGISPDGATAVWIDLRHPGPTGEASTWSAPLAGSEVYLKDLANNAETRLTFDAPAAPALKAMARVAFGRVVWNSWKEIDGGTPGANLYAWDTSGPVWFSAGGSAPRPLRPPPDRLLYAQPTSSGVIAPWVTQNEAGYNDIWLVHVAWPS